MQPDSPPPDYSDLWPTSTSTSSLESDPTPTPLTLTAPAIPPTPPTPNNLPSLPPEIIERILQLAARGQPFDPIKVRTLLTCSLVSPIWRAISQTILFRDPELESPSQCRALAETLRALDRPMVVRSLWLHILEKTTRRRQFTDEEMLANLFRGLPPLKPEPDGLLAGPVNLMTLLELCSEVTELCMGGPSFEVVDLGRILGSLPNLQRLHLDEFKFRLAAPLQHATLSHLTIRAMSADPPSWENLSSTSKTNLSSIDFFGAVPVRGLRQLVIPPNVAIENLFTADFISPTIKYLAMGHAPACPTICMIRHYEYLSVLDIPAQQLQPDDYLVLPPNLQILRFHGAFPLYPPTVNPKTFLHAVTHIIRGRSSAKLLQLIVIPTPAFRGGGTVYQREASGMFMQYKIAWEESEPEKRGLMVRYDTDFKGCEIELFGNLRVDTEAFRVAIGGSLVGS